MSQILVRGNWIDYPYYGFNSSSNTFLSATTLNAAGESLQFIGTVNLENPTGGGKTISAAGGGSIVWSAGTVTFANAGTTFKVGIQDVSTTTSPAQGDGTFDVEASFTGGGGGVTASAKNTSVMTTGTKTIAQGDMIAICFTTTTRGGTDAINVNATAQALVNSGVMPVVSSNVGGSFAKVANVQPNAYIIFNDGTTGSVNITAFTPANGTSISINGGTATADEYGNYIKPLASFYAMGIAGMVNFGGTSSDCELLLYTDPLGTPAVARTISVDATHIATGITRIQYLFSTPYLLKPNTEYAISLRPTTANNNVTIYFRTGVDTANSGDLGPPNTNHYAVRRLDNSGAFSDYNGGTAKTRLTSLWLVGTYMEQGVNMCSGQVGVY